MRVLAGIGPRNWLGQSHPVVEYCLPPNRSVVSRVTALGYSPSEPINSVRAGASSFDWGTLMWLRSR